MWLASFGFTFWLDVSNLINKWRNSSIFKCRRTSEEDNDSNVIKTGMNFTRDCHKHIPFFSLSFVYFSIGVCLPSTNHAVVNWCV